MNSSTQVLVIGGGPAGSTASTLLARAGFDVTLVERDVFPRYHIGESLLPSCMEVLDLLGVREKVESHGFKQKHGGYFEWGNEQWELNFKELRYPYAFQVVRSEFDHLLLEHAKSQGVKVYEGVEIRGLSFDRDRPRRATWSQVAEDGRTGEISFDFLVDASGRAGIVATRYLRSRHYHKPFQNIAIWGYWKGAKTLANAPEGAIANGSVPNGWLWGIPLHNGTMSVGFVTHKESFKERREQTPSLEQIYYDAIAECPLIADLVKPAELVSGVRVEQDYSYAADSFAGPGYLIVGDAACFIDPLLSTGVHLATFSATLAAASIGSILRDEISEQQATTFYDKSYRDAYLRLIVIVSSMYKQYEGKDSYFWKAQQLTSQDYGNLSLQQAFLYVVSGLADLKHTKADTSDAVSVKMSPPQEQNGSVFRRVSSLWNPLPLVSLIWPFLWSTMRSTLLQIAVKQKHPQSLKTDKATAQLYDSVFFVRSTMSPISAVNGLYVTTKPRLGLVNVQKEYVHSAL